MILVGARPLKLVAVACREGYRCLKNGTALTREHGRHMTLDIETLTVNDATIAWAWVGAPSPAPLVFLHGLGDSAILTFEDIARHPTLTGKSSLLIDLPGFGYGHAPDDWPATMEDHAQTVISLLDHLDVRRATVVGHSMGGSLALLVASTIPDRVEQLILAEPLLLPEQSTLGKAIAKRPERAFVERGYAMLVLATRRQALRGEQAAQGFREPLQRANPVILHRSAVSLLSERRPSFLDMLRNLTVRWALLVGGRSTGYLEGMGVDEGRRVVIPDAGHSMMTERPDVFALSIASGIDEALRSEDLGPTDNELAR